MKSIEDIERISSENIKRIRTSKKMTQAFVAEKVGVSEKFVSDIETGRSHCSLTTLVSIANVLDVEPYELLLPKGQGNVFDSQRANFVMQQLKNNFCDMVDTLSQFLEAK